MIKNIALLIVQFVLVITTIVLIDTMYIDSYGWSASEELRPAFSYISATVAMFFGIWFRLGLDELNTKSPSWSEFLKNMTQPKKLFPSLILSVCIVISLRGSIENGSYGMITINAFQNGFLFRSVLAVITKS